MLKQEKNGSQIEEKIELICLSLLLHRWYKIVLSLIVGNQFIIVDGRKWSRSTSVVAKFSFWHKVMVLSILVISILVITVYSG